MMRYFGSKASTVQHVVKLALSGMQVNTAADAFGGLGIIGAELRRQDVRVTTCDLLTMPYAFQYVRVACSVVPRYLSVRQRLGLRSTSEVAHYLNSRSNRRSWLVREFASERRFFLPGNAARIAGAWDAIRRWDKQSLLSEPERNHVIASLINGVDACANTAGTYYAFLKDWDRKAKRNFAFKFIDVAPGHPKGEAFKGDALALLRGKSFDLLYLDPPYNERDYARYYHLPESLANLARPKTNPDSLSGQPVGEAATSTKFREALRLAYLTQVVQEVRWKRLVVQYADNAFIRLADLREMLGAQGKMREIVVDALRYTTKSEKRHICHHVFVVDKPSATARRFVVAD